MTFIDRKRTWFQAVCAVLATPFQFLAVGFLLNLPWLFLAAVLCLVSVWLSGQAIGPWMPNEETLFILIGVMVFVALAAIPLVIRDHLKDRGYERIWVPTPQAEEAGHRYMQLLLDGALDQLHQHFSMKLQAAVPVNVLKEQIQRMNREIGGARFLHAVRELEIAPGPPFSDYDFDCVVDARTDHSDSQNREDVFVFYLDSRSDFEIIGYQLPECEAEFDD